MWSASVYAKSQKKALLRLLILSNLQKTRYSNSETIVCQKRVNFSFCFKFDQNFESLNTEPSPSVFETLGMYLPSQSSGLKSEVKFVWFFLVRKRHRKNAIFFFLCPCMVHLGPTCAFIREEEGGGGRSKFRDFKFFNFENANFFQFWFNQETLYVWHIWHLTHKFVLEKK